jgi:transcriptional regulator of arginine metabolism
MQLGKTERQRLIESLVSRKRIGTQFELLDALADAGCVVTQATVSRDIRQLGLE